MYRPKCVCSVKGQMYARLEQLRVRWESESKQIVVVSLDEIQTVEEEGL